MKLIGIICLFALLFCVLVKETEGKKTYYFLIILIIWYNIFVIYEKPKTFLMIYPKRLKIVSIKPHPRTLKSRRQLMYAKSKSMATSASGAFLQFTIVSNVHNVRPCGVWKMLICERASVVSWKIFIQTEICLFSFMMNILYPSVLFSESTFTVWESLAMGSQGSTRGPVNPAVSDSSHYQGKSCQSRLILAGNSRKDERLRETCYIC